MGLFGVLVLGMLTFFILGIFAEVIAHIVGVIGGIISIGILVLIAMGMVAAFGIPGLVAFFLVLAFFGWVEQPTRKRTKKRKKSPYKKWREMDEELEDYDYMDWLGGKDRPWIDSPR
jgi:hypothetical protein